jgi:hypothetical protein
MSVAFSPEFLNLIFTLGGCGEIALEIQKNMGSFPAQSYGDSPSDTLVAPCYQRYSVFEIHFYAPIS